MTILGALMGFLLLSGSGMTGAPAAVASSTPPVPSYHVALTAYNAVPAQTDDSPDETASGAFSNPEVVAARSQDLGDELPFGTIVEIDGPASKQEGCGYALVNPLIGYRVIADTMNVRFTKRIDVLFDTSANYKMSDGSTRNAADLMGLCHGVTVRVVGHIDPSQMGRLPKTQEALASLVTAPTGVLAVK